MLNPFANFTLWKPSKKNYVGDQGISFSWTINITDNVNISILEQ